MFVTTIAPVPAANIEIGMTVWVVKSHDVAPTFHIVETVLRDYVWTDKGCHGIPVSHIVAAYHA